MTATPVCDTCGFPAVGGVCMWEPGHIVSLFRRLTRRVTS